MVYNQTLLSSVLQELTDAERKQWLLSALDKLKEALPKFSTAMQNFVKNPSSTPAKVSVARDLLLSDFHL